MIIKSLSRKTETYGDLYKYFHKERCQKKYTISYNLYKTETQDDVLSQFKKNGDLLPKRKNGVMLYHEIISLPQQKGPKTLPIEKQKEILLDIAYKYLEARSPLNLAYGVIHEESEGKNLHCHLMISSNEILNPKRTRLSKERYANIQRDIEKYKEEKYPFLADKKLYNKERVKNKYQSSQSKDRENKLKHRTKKPSRTDLVQQRVREAITFSNSFDEFKERLTAYNLEFYVRGNTPGVIDIEGKSRGLKKNNFRLKRLNLEDSYLNLLIFEKEKNINNIRTHEKDLERE